MSDLDFVEFVNNSRRNRKIGPRRYLRDYSNPFEKYSPREFHSRYRFTPNDVKNTLLPMLEPNLHKTTKRGLPFAPEIMILITLRYFATGSFQKLHGDVMEICQQSVSRIITKISILFASKMKDFVKFPAYKDINQVKQKFYEVASFPGIIGCIDCTHIKIKNPGGTSSEVFRNKKGWFSINVQAVTGPNLIFFDLVVRWPGSTHNSFIYNSSSLKQRLITGQLEGFLLGNSSYDVSNVLLTPFSTPSTNSQEKYNESHIKTRNSVEQVFGIWKRKFPCLQVGMNIKLDTVVAVICACALLHNISISLDDSILLASSDESVENDFVNVPIHDNPNSTGCVVRESLVERFFSS